MPRMLDDLPGPKIEFWQFCLLAIVVIVICVVAIMAKERQPPYIDVVVNGRHIDRVEYPGADSANAQEVLGDCGDMMVCFPVHVWYPDGLKIDTVKVVLKLDGTGTMVQT